MICDIVIVVVIPKKICNISYREDGQLKCLFNYT